MPPRTSRFIEGAAMSPLPPLTIISLTCARELPPPPLVPPPPRIRTYARTHARAHAHVRTRAPCTEEIAARSNYSENTPRPPRPPGKLGKTSLLLKLGSRSRWSAWGAVVLQIRESTTRRPAAPPRGVDGKIIDLLITNMSALIPSSSSDIFSLYYGSFIPAHPFIPPRRPHFAVVSDRMPDLMRKNAYAEKKSKSPTSDVPSEVLWAGDKARSNRRKGDDHEGQCGIYKIELVIRVDPYNLDAGSSGQSIFSFNFASSTSRSPVIGRSMLVTGYVRQQRRVACVNRSRGDSLTARSECTLV
ncbi:hypothetical protein EVAR_3706_1 [Eumeta japonica]|uniref:Uncharacterized protein n=1 Tax=Eumeta variegata TaxID=151549 RepID=A0A4C1SU46_EUMVA|nr:hypothetical protein EVAR_3706_1 [Eumeta japonica]